MSENNHLIRIMFVDDEDKTRKLLQICIDWEEIGYTVVHDAPSASYALELIPKEKPDVIITDIEMPFINGIDFAQMVSEEYPNIKIVFLTAHDMFNYAKKGVEIGISSFLLKPINRHTLIESMVEIRKQLLLEREEMYEYEVLKSRLNDNWNYIIKSFLTNILIESLPQDQLQESLKYYKIPLSGNTSYYNILLIYSESHGDAEERITQQIQCQRLIEPTIKRADGTVLFTDQYNNIVILSENKKINLYAYAAHFSSFIKENLKLTVFTGIGRPVENLQDIRTSYKQAYDELQVSRFSKDQVSFSYMKQDNHHANLMDSVTRVKDDIALYLKIPVEDKVLEEINKLYDLIEHHPTIPFSNVVVISFSLVDIILTTISNIGIPYYEIYQTDNLPYAYLLEIKNIKGLRNYLINLVKFTVEQIKKHNQDTGNQMINKIVEYINDNLDNPRLSLKTIAEVNYISTSYLSRKFKSVMGNNIMDYLAHLRIEKAKHLLNSTDLKVYEVGERVGINDSNYFSKYFKKYTDYTPTQYKEFLIQNNNNSELSIQ